MESYIQQLHRQVRSKRSAKLGLRYPTIFDIFLIARLLRGGTFEGAFTEQFMRHNGPGKLFVHLFKLLYKQWVGRIGQTECLVVISSNQRDIGLLHMGCAHNRVGAQSYSVNMVALLHAYRRQNLAAPILQAMIDLLSSGSTLQAYCNRQSRALRDALCKLDFSRGHSQLHGLTCYCYVK